MKLSMFDDFWHWAVIPSVQVNCIVCFGIMIVGCHQGVIKTAQAWWWGATRVIVSSWDPVSPHFSSDFHRRKESLMTIMKTAAALILLATITHAQPAPKENPTWFIPSGPKPAGQDDQSFCTAELELSTEQYQTRTSEIILPEELEPAVCIIFPFAPNTLRYGAGISLSWGILNQEFMKFMEMVNL